MPVNCRGDDRSMLRPDILLSQECAMADIVKACAARIPPKVKNDTNPHAGSASRHSSQQDIVAHRRAENSRGPKHALATQPVAFNKPLVKTGMAPSMYLGNVQTSLRRNFEKKRPVGVIRTGRCQVIVTRSRGRFRLQATVAHLRRPRLRRLWYRDKRTGTTVRRVILIIPALERLAGDHALYLASGERFVL